MARKRGPIVPPGRDHDPENTEPLIARASAEWRRRLREVKSLYVRLLDSIPRVEVVTNAKRYAYQLFPDMLGSIDQLIDDILLEGGADSPWLFENYVQAAFERGTARAVRNLAAQSAAYRAERSTLRDVMRQPAYQRRIAMVRARVFEDMKGLGGQVKADMGRLLADGVARGKGPLEIARNLTEQLRIEDYRAERIARTEMNTALRRARWDETEDAQATYGLKTQEMHISALSPTTREEHAARHGKLYTLEEARDWFSDGSNSINCFLPDTHVSGRFVAGSKAHYRGDIIQIVTAGGRNLRVTPNHPIMTNMGLVPAHKLHEGCYLFTDGVEVKYAVGVSALHGQEANPRIDNVFAAASDIGHALLARVSAVDFHGDGGGMDKDIDVVNMDRPLPCGVNAHAYKLLDDFALEHSNTSNLRLRAENLDGICVGDMPPSLVSFGDEGQSLLSGAVGSALEGGLTFALVPESTTLEKSDYGTPAVSEAARNRQDAFPIGVHTPDFGGAVDVPYRDVVIGISVFHYNGDVYDLEEVSGLMFANGILTSNCKCSTVTVLTDEKGEPIVQSIVDRTAEARRKFEQERKHEG